MNTPEDRCQIPDDLDPVDLDTLDDDGPDMRAAAKGWPGAIAAALREWLPGRVRYLPGWDTRHRGIGWKGPRGVPSGLMIHHTGGARTESTNPRHPGNADGADSGAVAYIQGHYDVPAASFTLTRSGHLYVHSVWPVWHAGRGSFRGVHPFDRLGIPDHAGNDHLLGVEVCSRGRVRDFTAAQLDALGPLACACQQAAGWATLTARLPEHDTWAPTRKIDTRYPRAVFLDLARQARVLGPHPGRRSATFGESEGNDGSTGKPEKPIMDMAETYGDVGPAS